jgi:hypothetical protein
MLGSLQGGTDKYVRKGTKKKQLNFAHERNVSDWKTLAQRRKRAYICVLVKAYTGNGLRRIDIGNYSFVNRTVQLQNQLLVDALGTLSCKPINFKEIVRKAINDK